MHNTPEKKAHLKERGRGRIAFASSVACGRLLLSRKSDGKSGRAVHLSTSPSTSKSPIITNKLLPKDSKILVEQMGRDRMTMPLTIR